MRAWSRSLRIAVALATCVLLFLLFFNGYQNQGPSRKKFHKSGESSVDLTIEEKAVPVVADDLKRFINDKRVQKWVESWQRCVPDLKLEELTDVGAGAMESEPVDAALVQEELKGPGAMFYTKAPGGKRAVNPYWERLRYRKEGDSWQPYVELRCGILAYEPSAKRATVVQSCTLNEGLDDVFWLDADHAVVVGYESVTRQMSTECESVESCFAPAIWFLDFSKELIHSYRGKVLKRGLCNLDDYLRKRLPGFFTP